VVVVVEEVWADAPATLPRSAAAIEAITRREVMRSSFLPLLAGRKSRFADNPGARNSFRLPQ
jgi:hypothetical protein